MTLRRITPLLLVLGLVLMIPFGATATRLPGIACLLGFVVCGLFLIASPTFLEADETDHP